MNYRNAISVFEKYLEIIYSTNNEYGTEHRGYLINLKDYEMIKKNTKNNCSGIIYKINQIEFKTPQYLINMILNGNKYIFINTDLWELICDNDKNNNSPIIYKVNSYDITFNLDNLKLSFSHNKNIIDQKSFRNSHNYKSNYEKITKIVDSVIKYYNFENKIMNDLKNKRDYNSNSYEYLISKNWINKWKIFSNYEDIKAIYLENNLNNKKDIMNDLIFYLEKNKINYNELSNSVYSVCFRIYNTKKENIEFYLKNDSLVLITYEFLSCFSLDISDFFGNSVAYNAFNNKINFYLDNREILSFKSNNNIISLNGIINYSHLKQLINIFYFQKKLKSYINGTEVRNKIYLINKKVINLYKNIFNYKQLYDFLNSNSNTQTINYNNLDIYYYEIINVLLNNDYIDKFIQIEENKNLNTFKDINENFIELEYKINYPSEKYLKYIINFEIVNKDIKDFFIENNIAKEEHFISLNSYTQDHRKALIIFEKDSYNFYEIGHFNDNEDFIIEYLIDELEKINKYSIIEHFKYGIDPSIKNYSKELQNIINLDFNTKKICYYYKIEEINKPKENKIYQAQKRDNIIYCKKYLINKNKIKEQNKNENISLNINNNKINKYLSYLIIIYNEYSKIKKEINEKTIIQSNGAEEEYYLINRKYMNELENILHFKEFSNEINIDEIQNLDLDINNINNDVINQIHGKLKMKAYLLTLDDNKLINNGNNHYISKIELYDNENNKLYYYNNCQIINKKIYLLLNQIDLNISSRTIFVRCVLKNSKIIIFTNNNIINIGYLSDDNIYIIEHIIYSDSSKDISKIFKILQKTGYTFIQKYFYLKRIKINNNNDLLEAKIYSLLEEKETKKNLSSKLKALILLSIFSQKNYYKDNNIEKVFLINKDWLLQYKYDEINKLIDKNEKLRFYLKKEKIFNLSIDSNLMNDIISLLNYDSLLKIDEYTVKIFQEIYIISLED